MVTSFFSVQTIGPNQADILSELKELANNVALIFAEIMMISKLKKGQTLHSENSKTNTIYSRHSKACHLVSVWKDRKLWRMKAARPCAFPHINGSAADPWVVEQILRTQPWSFVILEDKLSAFYRELAGPELLHQYSDIVQSWHPPVWGGRNENHCTIYTTKTGMRLRS